MEHADELEQPAIATVKVDGENFCLGPSRNTSDVRAPRLFRDSHLTQTETGHAARRKNSQRSTAVKTFERLTQSLSIELALSSTSLLIDKNPAFTKFRNC